MMLYSSVAKVLDRLGRRAERVIPPSLTMPLLAAAQWLVGEPELRRLADIVPPDRLALDVGAADGVWSWFLRRHARRVIAFEPNPASAERVRQRVPDVELHPVALSNYDGHVELRVPIVRGQALAGWGTVEPTNTHPALPLERYDIVRVPTRTLDSFELKDVGFIKIDVEGHEIAVLEGGIETLRRERPVIVVEAEDQHRPGAVISLQSYLKTAGYRLVWNNPGPQRSANLFVFFPK